MTTESRGEKIFVNTLGGILIASAITMFAGMMYFTGEATKALQKWAVKTDKMSSLTDTAIKLSQGKDNIWSDNEKRKFLDANGLKNSSFQSGEAFTLKPDLYTKGVEVLGDYKSGWLIFPSEGHFIGYIPKKNIEQYVSNHDK